MKKETILITGAGSGLGKLTALTLAKIGYPVIATTETERQAALLEDDASALKIPLTIEKIDITNKEDRLKAWTWDIDILVNNAGVSEGGSLVDVPEAHLRNQYEVNVFATLLFTQGFARQMIQKKEWSNYIHYLNIWIDGQCFFGSLCFIKICSRRYG